MDINKHSKVWLVWSNEHNAYWGTNKCGYTQNAMKAGRYTAREAKSICKNANIAVDKNKDLPNEIITPSPEVLDIVSNQEHFTDIVEGNQVPI